MMMEISEEAREKCHTKILNAESQTVAGKIKCEFLANAKKIQDSAIKLIENKQNIDFGAEFATTMQTSTEMKSITNPAAAAATTTCAKVVGDESLDVTELTTDQLGVAPYKASPTADKHKENNKDIEEDKDCENQQTQKEKISQESSRVNPDDEDDDDDDDPENSDDNDESSSDSDFSDLSGMSEESGREWKPITKPINWVQKQIHSGANPRDLLSQMLPNSSQIAPGLNDMTLWRILASMLSEPPRRQKLRYINTFADVIQLVCESKNIIVLTGAGVSVSCGIPDFRSSDGIYSRLAKDFPDLPDPQAMFDINYFSRDPRPFFKFAREIYPGQFKPSPCHRFIKLLETKQKLLRNYTQNIDTLEQVAGIQNVIECHGSFSTASCTKCKLKTTADAIRADIFAQRIPVCPRCQPNVLASVDASEPVSELELRQIVENGIMKPDIVFFGEGLPEKFHTVMASDKDKCDLLIVIGSSLKVRPVALIPSSIPAHVPQILINREQLHHLEFDVELLGDSDVIINQLCHRLGSEWKDICFDSKILRESTELLAYEDENNEEDEAQQFRLDTDTQSVKSNASTDIALRSAGGYSDSGFESSTSSGVVGSKVGAIGANSDTDSEAATEAIQEIKSSILELNNTLIKAKSNADLLTPELLEDDNTDAVDFENPIQFHSAADSYRHLSIDSSKDSGIQCNDSSNSATATNGGSAGTLLPPLKHFGDSGGTQLHLSASANNTSSAAVAVYDTNTSAQSSISSNNISAATTQPSNDVERKVKRCLQKNISAAERLIEGTYYCHEISSAYVFPGAQVSWCTDSDVDGELEPEEEEEEIDFEDDDDDDVDEDAAAALIGPSIKAEVITEITTTSTRTVCGIRTTSTSTTKRRSSENVYEEETCLESREEKLVSFSSSCSSSVATTTATLSSAAPPMKKRRSSNEDDNKETARLLNTALNSNSSTTTTLIAASGHSLDAATVVCETSATTPTISIGSQETLLQL